MRATLGLRWDDPSGTAGTGLREPQARPAAYARTLADGVSTAGLRLAVAAILFIGLLAVVFSRYGGLGESFGAQAPLLPNAAFSVLPDFTPVGAARPEVETAFRRAPAVSPSWVHLASSRLLVPHADAASPLLRLALADPKRICAAIRAGEDGSEWGAGQQGFAAFECFSAAVVEADEPMIPMPAAPEMVAEEDEGFEPVELEEGRQLVEETELVAAPPKRSFFTIARGETAGAVGFVRMKVLGETRKEALVAGGEAALALERLFGTLGWAMPGDAAAKVAALEPVEITDSGTRILFAREGGTGENYNLSVLFPDRAAFAGTRRLDTFEPRPKLTAAR